MRPKADSFHFEFPSEETRLEVPAVPLSERYKSRRTLATANRLLSSEAS
jgi:hypothetical protein